MLPEGFSAGLLCCVVLWPVSKGFKGLHLVSVGMDPGSRSYKWMVFHLSICGQSGKGLVLVNGFRRRRREEVDQWKMRREKGEESANGKYGQSGSACRSMCITTLRAEFSWLKV